MKIFKTVDERLHELGYRLVSENKHGAEYRIYDEDFKYLHVVHLIRKMTGENIIQSYESGTNRVVGLTYKEMKLFTKKMKQLFKKGWCENK